MTESELAVDPTGAESGAEPEAGTEEDEALQKLKAAISVEKQEVGPLRLKLTITVPRDTVNERLVEQFSELRRDAVIPGFRKGHAPMKLVEKRFGNDVGNDLVTQLVSRGYMAAVEKEGLKTLGDPLIWATVSEDRTSGGGQSRKVDVEKLMPVDKALELIHLPKEGPLQFSCEVELRPTFELPPLSGIKVTKPSYAVTDQDVEREIRARRAFAGTFEPVENGAVEADDLTYVDMTMTVGGEEVFHEENIDLPAREVRIRGVPLRGLAAGLVGKAIGDTASFDAVVPDDHETSDFRGKTASFSFLIREIKRLAVPPIDEAFLKSMGFDDESGMRSFVRSYLEFQVIQRVRADMHRQICRWLVENTPMELPSGVSERQTERAILMKTIELLRANVPPAEADKQAEALRDQTKESVANDLKLLFILERIAEKWGVDVSEDEINGAIAEMAARQNKRFDRVRDELMAGERLPTLWRRLRDEKIFALLLEEADKVAEGPPAADA